MKNNAFSRLSEIGDGSETYHMEKSFLDILSEKIASQIQQEYLADKTSSLHEKSPHYVSNPFTNEPLERVPDEHSYQWVSQIPCEKIHFKTPKTQVLGRIYPLNPPRKKPAPQPQLRKKHALTESQNQSLVYFWGWQIMLKSDFSREELKKAFRALAHRLHPDRNQGKSAAAFLELKAHYYSLSAVFIKP